MNNIQSRLQCWGRYKKKKTTATVYEQWTQIL